MHERIRWFYDGDGRLWSYLAYLLVSTLAATTVYCISMGIFGIRLVVAPIACFIAFLAFLTLSRPIVRLGRDEAILFAYALAVSVLILFVVVL